MENGSSKIIEMGRVIPRGRSSYAELEQIANLVTNSSLKSEQIKIN